MPDVKQTLDGETMHLTPALSPLCSADSAQRGEGETLPANVEINGVFSAEQENSLRHERFAR
jgi:hypothetical protein